MSEEKQEKQEKKLRNTRPVFTTGKMEHIFEFDQPGKKAMYLPKYTSQEAEEAMNSFERMYMKIDGSCGALIRNDKGEFDIYARFDDTKKKFRDDDGKFTIPEGYLPLPEGGNSAKYEGHRYYLRKLNRPVETDEKGAPIKLKGEDVFVAQLYKSLDEADPQELSLLPDFNSIELVGKNYNQTPGVVGNGIALHSQQRLDIKFPEKQSPEEWLENLRTLMESEEGIVMEGVVIEHKGTWWKIRADHLCKGNKKDRSKHVPPALFC